MQPITSPAAPDPAVLHLDGVVKRSPAGRYLLEGASGRFHAGWIYVVTGGNAPARQMLSRVMAGIVPLDEGRIARDGPPPPILGAAMGFNVGGPILRGLEMRAAAYGLDHDDYVDKVAAALPNPEILRRQLAKVNPVDRALVLHASTYLLPCSYFVAEGAPWPADGDIRQHLDPLIEQTRRRAAFICVSKKTNIAPNEQKREIVRLRAGALVFSQRKRRRKKQAEEETA